MPPGAIPPSIGIRLREFPGEIAQQTKVVGQFAKLLTTKATKVHEGNA
jgi:hypothetical protein